MDYHTGGDGICQRNLLGCSVQYRLGEGTCLPICAARYFTTWHMLVADDFHLDAGRPEHRPALTVCFVLCAVSCGRVAAFVLFATAEYVEEDVPNNNMEDVCSVMVETHPYSTVQQRAAKRRPNEGDAGYDTK